ncbi:DMT family transporter [Neptunitalea lumnitzerae]|uniref:Permease n=1 Tax=Neptunitalea lumnitzerae TaxID=2965509 RepID=A0ABQ5MKJ2_9FLAO|nr:DMT family transporter [Neptunitalea sp. Y10]GLB49933.1 permease [Neptunitalea sp. Y10]
MLGDKVKNYLHLHIIVFLWGFTAVLGALITLEALPLVWYRMLIASLVLGVVLVFKKRKTKLSFKLLMQLFLAGSTLALHWVCFFEAIKVSNVSVTLICIATGAFFAAILEPIFYKRKIVLYEIILGTITILGLLFIFNLDTHYLLGIVLGLSAAFLSALLSILNGKLAKQYDAALISFYELSFGVLFITGMLLFRKPEFFETIFTLTFEDFSALLVLAVVCTAYAFLSSVKVMRFLSPYTVMLTINLEPVYGVVLAYLFLDESERMSVGFYVGGLVILATVLLNGYLKTRKKRKSVPSTT